MRFYSPIDMGLLEIVQFKTQNSAAQPYTPAATNKGAFWMDTALNLLRWSDGSSWQAIYPFSTTANGTAVLRDGSGNFTAGTITATLSGLASSATVLATSRNFSITGKATASAVGFTGAGDVALNVTALSIVPGDISLTSGSFIVGNGSNVGAVTAKSSIPLSGFGAATADVAMGSFKITGLADPVNAQDAATKNYVDSTAQGLDVKGSCRVATTADLGGTYASQVITGPAAALVIDGVTMALNERVLVKNQTTASQNGIYTVTAVGGYGSAWTLTRATDFNTSAKASPGSFTFIEEGTNNKDTGWVMTADAPVALDTTALPWAQFSGAGSYTAGRGMNLSGNQFNFAQSTAYTVGDLPYASGASTIGMLTAVATGNVLLSGGAGVAPSWGKVDLTAAVTVLLPVANGGTGINSVINNGVSYGSGGSHAYTAAMTAGQVLLGNASGVPTPTSVTGDVTISGAGVTAIGANKVLYSMFQQVAGLSVVGVSGTATANVAAITGSTDQVLRVNSAGNALGFGALNLASSSAVTGTLGISNGGTGLSAIGSANTVLRSNGSAASWGSLNLATDVTGILGGANGGTGTQYAQFTGGSALRTYSLPNLNAQLAAQVSGSITGNGSTTAFTATHNLNTKNIVIALYDSSDNLVHVDTQTTTVNAVTLTFGVAPTNGTAYRWVVVGY